MGGRGGNGHGALPPGRHRHGRQALRGGRLRPPNTQASAAAARALNVTCDERWPLQVPGERGGAGRRDEAVVQPPAPQPRPRRPRPGGRGRQTIRGGRLARP